MHYEKNAFAIDKSTPTIVPRMNRDEIAKMGQRVGLSGTDIEKINRLYNCTDFAETRSRKAHHRRHGHRRIRKKNAAYVGAYAPEYIFLTAPNVAHGHSSSFQQSHKTHENNTATVAFKSTQDFFIRTGLKPAGPTSFGMQLPDGTVTVPISLDPGQSQMTETGNGYDGYSRLVAKHSPVEMSTSYSSIPGAQFSPENLPTWASTGYFGGTSPTVDSIVCETPAQANCVDRRNDCVELSLKGDCDKRPGFMLRLCRRSCCNCDDKKCYDSKDEQKYATLCLAQNRQSNSVVLSACDVAETRQNALDYCPKTCGTCSVPVYSATNTDAIIAY
ncbi:astacin (Peptidase family m12A) domain-containing protein [Ditylenchus destructor]|uniref:Astacin (Peptidase family m12A) domain-containing protein n=1 Tax=Ditylenchus destructor TaxID=166010 RepID=A0AAD4R679_9BILA|nr:astacin (Peptidase family m12A) domain-containing protein [Ditylenchus destructor]